MCGQSYGPWLLVNLPPVEPVTGAGAVRKP